MIHWVKYSTAGPSRDVNVPKDLAHRSFHGDTLMLIPGHSYELTNDEMEHLRRKHPDIVRHLRPLGRVS